MAWETVPLNHDDEAALDLLSRVLSDGRGTRLDDALYYDKQRTSDIASFTFNRYRAGQFVIYASSPGKTLPKLAKYIHKELGKLSSDPPTQVEVDRARRAIEGELLDAMEHPERKARLLADCYLETGEADCLDDLWQRYEAVTPADVARVAATYLLNAEPNTLSTVPMGDDGQIEGAVEVQLP